MTRSYYGNCNVCGKKLGQNTVHKLCVKCFSETRRKKYIDKWLKEGITKIGKLQKWIRDYIFAEQNGKCSICGMQNIWNNKPLKFVLDHIDGNSRNNERKNLRLICYNCDSQLPTFKNKNKGHGREYDRNLYHSRKNG